MPHDWTAAEPVVLRYDSPVRDLSAERERDDDAPDVGREVSDVPTDMLEARPQVRVYEWADLLRHKASALRSIRGAALRPGDFDAASLAAALARPQAPAPRVPLLPPSSIEEVLERAYRLWDSVADPHDPQAVEALAAQCEEVAGLLDAVPD